MSKIWTAYPQIISTTLKICSPVIVEDMATKYGSFCGNYGEDLSNLVYVMFVYLENWCNLKAKQFTIVKKNTLTFLQRIFFSGEATCHVNGK